MYELKENGKVFTSKSVGTGPSSCGKRIYRAAVSQMLRNTGIEGFCCMESARPIQMSVGANRTVKRTIQMNGGLMRALI